MGDGDAEFLYRGDALVKIGAVGMFVDNEWDCIYLVIGHGFIRIFASESDYRTGEGHVFELILNPGYLLSPVYILTIIRCP